MAAIIITHRNTTSIAPTHPLLLSEPLPLLSTDNYFTCKGIGVVIITTIPIENKSFGKPRIVPIYSCQFPHPFALPSCEVDQKEG